MTIIGNSTQNKEQCGVRVALRIRPQIEREKLDFCRICTDVIPNEPQVIIGEDRCFTYDHVFDVDTSQQFVYEKCVEDLINGTFDGYNATVLAYGQTGSGKTYTMGTAFDMNEMLNKSEIGIVPRAVNHLFGCIEEKKVEARENNQIEPEFQVAVQFVELYNEEIVDLLTDDSNTATRLKIHEDNGEIVLNGAITQCVSNPEETLSVLKNGAVNRKTASTNMNEQSSRSHAIFTMFIKQRKVANSSPKDDFSMPGICPENLTVEFDVYTAKFHFVDLAGSERLKRTGATGHRAKEGISINCGLLALGNVISALGASSGRIFHVPYRDSKLTRLLQDSLGGNSRTLMIACISPSDCDFVETLNTLKYANRAKNIKNKVVANRDKSSKLIGELRLRISHLESELANYKQGKITVGQDGVEALNDHYRENILLHADTNHLRIRIKALQETVEILKSRNIQLLAEKEDLNRLLPTVKPKMSDEDSSQNDVLSETIRNYLNELETLRTALVESNAMNEQMRHQLKQLRLSTKNSYYLSDANALNDAMTTSVQYDEVPELPLSPTSSLISEAKADIDRMKKCLNNDSSEIGKQAYEIANYESSVDGRENFEISEDEDDEESAEDECTQLRDDLADLQEKISLKERLVLELERSEQRLSEVRIMYEKKLADLSLRIVSMEAERDRVLADLASKSTQKGSEHVKKIREDYEKKLTTMRDEFKKLQSVQREYLRMQARQAVERQQLTNLKNEIIEFKKTKAQLMQKIKEERDRAKAADLANYKKYAALQKEARVKENMIQKLTSKDHQREAMLKKSMDEINRLRQQSRQNKITSNHPINSPHRSKNILSTAKGRPNKFSAKNAKNKWMNIEKYLTNKITERQTIRKMGEELERRVHERRLLLNEIENLKEAFICTEDLARRDVISELIDGNENKLEYIQSQITEIQNSIIAIDNANTKDGSAFNLESVIDTCENVDEAKYILQHSLNLNLDLATIASKLSSDYQEAEARIEHLQNEKQACDVVLEHFTRDEGFNKGIKQDEEKNARNVDEILSKENFQSNADDNPQSLLFPSGADNSEEEVNSSKASTPAESITSNVDNNRIDNFSPASPIRKGTGRIIPYTARSSNGYADKCVSSKLITRSHTLVGHSKTILSIDVKNNLLISGSKDQSAKIWDLERGAETICLGLHMNNVSCVRFVPNSHLVLTVSLYAVRIWDLRSSQCVRTLYSSGLTADGGTLAANTPRQNVVPRYETVINAAEIDPSGRFFFTSYCGEVRVWNLERFASFGRLISAVHGPRSEVSCLEVTNDGNPLVFTGSRDHFVKMYEVSTNGEGIFSPSVEFSPPHYDSVTSIRAYEDSVFTASKDSNIMRFSLKDMKRDHLELQAHSKWIIDMCLVNLERNLLVTCCRAGSIKLWDVDSTRNLRLVEDVKYAHTDSINALATKSDCNLILSGSSDSTIGLWHFPQI